MSKEHRENVVIYQGKYRKIASERKCTEREYNVQDNDDVAHKYVKIHCDTNKFPELPFCGPHTNSYVARGLSRHYYTFYPKLDYVICVIHHIPFVCVECKSMLDQHCISVIP